MRDATLSVSRRIGARSLVVLLVAGCLLPAGCTRRFYRGSADRQVEEVLTEKNCYERWRIEQWHVYPDPLARFADPTNPDRPPKPFDDPVAQDVSPNPQRPGKAGENSFVGVGYLELIKLWDATNRMDPESNRPPPPSSGALPPPTKTVGSGRDPLKSEQRAFRITLEQSSELGLINSREFQDRREDLYLAALAVTLERFAFAAQFFATEQVIREYVGSDRADAGNRWLANTGVGFSKLFPTGALLLFRLANQVVIEMSPNAVRRVNTPSTLSLDVTQPLLRGGGRAVTLEPLTQVERNLLYVIRSYARFREQFYVFIAGGDAIVTSFPGGGFVVQRLAASGIASPIGYLPTLLQAALLVNSRSNVAELERILTFYRQLQSGGEVSQLQSAQVESQLLEGRNDVLNREQVVRDFLDNFKLQLGVPTDLPLELDDAPVRPLSRHLNRLREVFEQDRQILPLEQRLMTVPPAQLRAELDRLINEAPLVQGTRFRDEMPAAWRLWQARSNEQIKAAIDRLLDERAVIVKRRTELENQGQTLPPADEARLDAVDFQLDLSTFEEALRAYEAKPWESLFGDLRPQERQERQQSLQVELFRRVFAGLIRLLSVAREERIAAAEASWPALPKACVAGVDMVDGDFDQALAAVAQTALTNRMDLMNARAQLVDSWRQIAVSANSLLGVVDVQYHLDATTPPLTGNPFAFSTTRTRNQLIFNTELPLVRRLERNQYRTALIAYQRQRRALQAAEDQVLLEVRSEVRQLRVQAENYKIQQRAVLVAYSQRDNSLEVLRAPTQPGQSTAATAASLTQQLLTAQSRVPRNENLLYQFYVNYLIARLQLFRDLDLMPLDPRGVWIDENAARDCDPTCRPAPAAEDRTQPERGQPERLPQPQPGEPVWGAPKR